jgi:alkanesulfonate monooxygenase
MLEEWFVARGADGFNIMPPILPDALVTFVDKVVPLLQERGLFRSDYEGTTLRDNLGLGRPPSRFATSGQHSRLTAVDAAG